MCLWTCSFSNNRPESNNNIPGTYIETDKSKENLYDGYIVYSKNKIGTNLPMRTKIQVWYHVIFMHNLLF